MINDWNNFWKCLYFDCENFNVILVPKWTYFIDLGVWLQMSYLLCSNLYLIFSVFQGHSHRHTTHESKPDFAGLLWSQSYNRLVPDFNCSWILKKCHKRKVLSLFFCWIVCMWMGWYITVVFKTVMGGSIIKNSKQNTLILLR